MIDVRGFRRALRQMERMLDEWVNSDCCSKGISLPQCHALLAVEELGDPSLRELTELVGVDKSTLSRTVDSLVQEGLLSRVTDEQDRRQVCITLTKKGHNVCSQINDRNDALFLAVFRQLGSDGPAVARRFEALVRAMAAERESSQGEGCASGGGDDEQGVL